MENWPEMRREAVDADSTGLCEVGEGLGLSPAGGQER